ncbi:MAG TPA: FAD-dependent oxidoreductase [Bacteroidota bacterium]|nr:FAD-dependent oxidoreductase [Bacteroidota bacterium]
MNSQQAYIESERCLQCFDAPCTEACPVHIDIPKFIGMIRSGNIIGAAEVVKTSNALANTCGKICPEEVFCQSVCTRAKQDAALHIRELHFFATQSESAKGFSKTRLFPTIDGPVAVIGAGPAGLSSAFELAKLGYKVDVFDKDGLGGVPRNSIPSFRLADAELDSDTRFLSKYFRLKKEDVNARTFEDIRHHYRAVFLGLGLGRDRHAGIPGERLKGVFPVLQFLHKGRSQPASLSIGNRVVIVGGGNVSLDAASTAKHLGAESVTLLYRRGEQEMRVWKGELREARRQGVELRFLTAPVAIVGTSEVTGVMCRQTRLSRETDASGRRLPVEVKGSDFVINADTVIIAIGQNIDAGWLDAFEKTEAGYLKVNKSFSTSVTGVFAGGDMIGGEGTIVQSIAQGKHAAHAIHEYLSKKQR